MFYKIAGKNVTRSLKDYSVYFLTLMFGVCIFYVFNSMDSQYVMEILLGTNKNIIHTILQLIDMLSAFVSVVLAFLVLYANGFMVKRRKKELGTYLLLGLSQGRVSSLLFLETLFIGVISLGVGLALGVFLSQFISVFTASLFAVTVPEFHFVFSPAAVGKTLLYFGVIFLVVMVFNSLSVSRCRLIDLLQAQRRNEELKLKSLRLSVVLFLVGAALLAVAYTMLLTRGLLRIDLLFWVMLALGTLGTLLFFRSLSGFLLRFCQKSKGLYYRGLNMFILRQFNSRIGSTYVSMTVICLMLLLAIGITASAIGLNNTVSDLTQGRAPYDMTVRFFIEGGEEPQLTDWLAANGFDVEAELKDPILTETRLISTDPHTYTVGGQEMTLDGLEAVSISSLNALLTGQGLRPLTLGEGEYGLLQGTYVAEESLIEAFWADGPNLVIGGGTYTAQKSAYTRTVVFTGSSFYSSMLILPDTALEGAPLVSRSVSGDYADPDVAAADARFHTAMRGFVPQEYQSEHGYGYASDSRLNIYTETMGSKVLVLFLGIYLGIVFLLTSAAVLALQQLSQAADNQSRYRVLARLGVEEKMRDRSVYVQVLLAFFLPLALAMIHSVVGMTAANAVIAEVGHVDSAASSFVTALFILVVYGAYFLATCWGSRRIVRGR